MSESEHPTPSIETRETVSEAGPVPTKTARKTARKRVSRKTVSEEPASSGESTPPSGVDGKNTVEKEADDPAPTARGETNPPRTNSQTDQGSGEEPSRSNQPRENQSFSERNRPKQSSPQQGGHPHRQHPRKGGRDGSSRGGFDPRQGKKNRNKRKGKRGGGGQPDPRFRVDGLPVVFDSNLEIGNLTWDEPLQNPEALESLFRENCDSSADPLNFNEIYQARMPELRSAAEDRGIELEGAVSRLRILNEILSKAQKDQQCLEILGTVEITDDGFGFLVQTCDNYRVKALSAFIPECIVDKWGLDRGHEVRALAIPPREGESCPVVTKITSVMDNPPESLENVVPFTELIPYYPLQRILLETQRPEAGWDNLSMRVVDLVSPIGFGQRGLIVAPPRTGKTVLLQNIAHSVLTNSPHAHLIILLVDERPEEVTDFRRRVDAEVISSTFDESAESHVHAAEMVIERARRMVENGRDVVILLDSITRLARAYNTTMPNSGKILSGGVEANALQKPKRFFGSARNIEEGGSLTIMGTALVDTGSKMDEVIFEEFKGTGNMELHLDRELVNKRIYPALSMEKSGTRKEELLYHPDEMNKVYSLRRAMKGIPSSEAMELLIQKVKKCGSNAEFLMTLR